MGIFDKFVKKKDVEPQFECEYCASLYHTNDELKEHTKMCKSKKDASKILSSFNSELSSIKLPKIKDIPKHKPMRRAVHISFRLSKSAKRRFLSDKIKPFKMSRVQVVPSRIVHKSTDNMFMRKKPKKFKSDTHKSKRLKSKRLNSRRTVHKQDKSRKPRHFLKRAARRMKRRSKRKK